MLQLHLAAIFGLLMIAYAGALARSNFRTISRKGTSSGRIILRMASSDSKLSRNVLVAIADGSEEIEAVTIVDTLVRAGATVTLASVSSSLQVTCSRGVKLVADRLITDCTSSNWDLICLPGGMPGSEHLRDNKELQQLLLKQSAEGKFVSAICAAPAVALAPLGLLKSKMATCYPAGKFRDVLQKEFTSNDAVVVDQNIITSQGPGTSLKFSLALVEVLYGTEMKDKLAKEMCAYV